MSIRTRALVSRTALGAMTAVTAALTLAIASAPAFARPSSSSLAAGSASAPAACRASQLRISIPVGGSGTLASGMGKQPWILVFRDVTGTACTLRGWPDVAVATPTGRTVATKVSDVTFGTIAQIPVARITVRPGQAAVVAADSPGGRGCVARWTLGLTLPGASRAVTVREPASSLAPCLGGELALSPFTSQRTWQRDISAMGSTKIPPPFPVSHEPVPALCRAAALRAAVTSAATGDRGAVITLHLSTSGPGCVLPEVFPTVRLHEAGGTAPMAKVYPDNAALRAARSYVTTYEHGASQYTALTLRPGHPVSIGILAATRGARRSCPELRSVSVYPTPLAVGASQTTAIDSPVSVCGTPRIMPFLPPSSARATALARQAIDAARVTASGITPAESSGFIYGTDSGYPYACGSGPYREPDGVCGDGTEGYYGLYVGESGTWQNWECGDGYGLNWVQGNYNAANDNAVDYDVDDVGASAYWFAAGPGRDPHYNGTTSEAETWGEDQGAAMADSVEGLSLDSLYFFLDMETAGDPDGNGWNSIWSGCGGSGTGSIAGDVDRATYAGFMSEVINDTGYLAGIYSAGGDYFGAWEGIMGSSETICCTAEWTFDNEQAEVYNDFPGNFSGSNASADWFASAPAACESFWQWSGGDGILNEFGGDYDQVDANRIYGSCT
jgi:hypothetical protein